MSWTRPRSPAMSVSGIPSRRASSKNLSAGRGCSRWTRAEPIHILIRPSFGNCSSAREKKLSAAWASPTASEALPAPIKAATLRGLAARVRRLRATSSAGRDAPTEFCAAAGCGANDKKIPAPSKARPNRGHFRPDDSMESIKGSLAAAGKCLAFRRFAPATSRGETGRGYALTGSSGLLVVLAAEEARNVERIAGPARRRRLLVDLGLCGASGDV